MIHPFLAESLAMKAAYLSLSVLGVVIPCIAFGRWLAEHGLAIFLLVHEVGGSPVAAFAWADVLVSAVTLLLLIAHQNRSEPVRYTWLAVAGLFVVGVSLALPLYLYLRERSREGLPAASRGAGRTRLRA